MRTKFDREKLVDNLPDAYAKAPESNLSKLFAIEQYAMAQLREAIAQVFDSLDLDTAKGRTLDLYGEMVGQERGAATDEQYRVLINSRILRNFTNGDYNSIVRAIGAIFGCEPADFVLTESENGCEVTLSGLPYSALNALGIDIETALKIIRELFPAGVSLSSLDFEGTFEFGGEELEYDEDAGFGNVEQTVGGYMGLLASGEGSDLPV